MVKAISTVIASILMLMIVVGLGGTAYLFISGTFTSKTATAFEIIDEVNGTVTIRNSGTEPLTSIIATLDGSSENIAVVPNIDGLIAYWSFNDGNPSQTVRDSFNENDGTRGSTSGSDANDPTWINGRYGNGLQFDGIDDFVYVSNFQDGSLEQLTIAFWANPSSSADPWPTIISTASQSGSTGFIWLYRGGTGESGPFVYQYANGVAYTALTWNDGFIGNNWHHYVLVADYTMGTFSLYRDGNLVELKIAGETTLTPPLRPLFIGRYEATHASSRWNGIIDEVAIYNQALSESKIQQLYSGLVPPGQLAKVKPLSSLLKGTHTLRLCTSSMCSTTILTVT